jgi:alpha-ketoglutarate-dependent 2,4-dichlorophenoxyacetate dioxygenase
METRPLHPQFATFAAEIVDVDISTELDPGLIRDIEKAIDTFAVVVFRDQNVSIEEQIRFGRRFGPLEGATLQARADNRHRTPYPEIVDIANLDERNNVQSVEDRRRVYNLGNRLWHTDSSFRALRGALSMLFARVIPPVGGETEFADLRAAYDALPADIKAQADPLWVEHDRTFGRAMLGVTNYTPEEIAAFPPVKHKLVQVHPTSGRTTLYLAAHAKDVVGWPVPDGRLFLRELMEAATEREFVYRHQWRVGDLVIWDNRCTMHRGRPFDEAYARDLTRVTTSDIGYVSAASSAKRETSSTAAH